MHALVGGRARDWHPGVGAVGGALVWGTLGLPAPRHGIVGVVPAAGAQAVGAVAAGARDAPTVRKARKGPVRPRFDQHCPDAARATRPAGHTLGTRQRPHAGRGHGAANGRTEPCERRASGKGPQSVPHQGNQPPTPTLPPPCRLRGRPRTGHSCATPGVANPRRHGRPCGGRAKRRDGSCNSRGCTVAWGPQGWPGRTHSSVGRRIRAPPPRPPALGMQRTPCLCPSP